MKAKDSLKFVDEEKRAVDAAIGLILFGFGLVLIVLGLTSILSSAVLSGYFYKTITTSPSAYIYPLFELILGIIVFSFSMWVFRVKV
jgi:formate/nitrite transporter FocA (FNT family)